MTDRGKEAEKYLGKIRNVEKIIHDKEQELEALRYKASGAGAIRYDKERVQTSPQNYMEMAMMDIAELGKEIEEDKASIEDIKGTAYGIVRVMQQAEERTVLEWFYLNGLSMEDTADKMHMSKRNAYYLKEDALESFGRILAG